MICYQNREFKGDVSFEFNDGNVAFSHNYRLKTQSMEVIVTTLIERGVQQKEDGSIFANDT